jgi:DNA primase
MRFSDGQLDDLRERADLVDLVGKRLPLQRTGKDFRGLCPFHGERTPSFYVVPHKKLYHCFGCGETGDVFKFFMKLDGLPFPEAVELVARESGVILVEEREDPEAARRRAHLDTLAALLERARKFYEQKLWHENGRAARQHLAERGIGDEWVRRFSLGFGGHGKDELARALDKAGADRALAIEAGLCIASTRGGLPFDRFSGRLLVPIRVPRPPDGRVVAFGGRHLAGVGPPPPPDRKPAKYINSPETPLYQKGGVLFGLDLARDAIRREERAVIVEGYFDVIGLHQAGFPLAVASCGTSLTPGHLELLTRTGARQIVFLFDGDAAGLKAAHRAAELCAKGQVPAAVATLPDGLDPDDFARRRGPDELTALLARAKPAIELLIDHALGEPGPRASVEERVRAVRAVRTVVLSAPEGLARELYIGQIAERLNVPVEAVRAVIAENNRARSEGLPEGARSPGRSARAAEEAAAPDLTAEFNAFGGPKAGGPLRESSFGRGGAARAEEGARSGRSGAVASRSPTEVVAARRTFAAEEVVTLALLKHPVLAPTVAQEGVLGDFLNAALRSLSERVIASQAEGRDVVPAELLATVEDPALREDLTRKLAAESKLEEQAEHLGRVLDKFRLEIRRKRAQEALATHDRQLADDAARQAFLEEQNKRLEETRAVHLRLNERDRPK